MDRNTKLQALLATAKAYKNRGTWLQYDQLSMDRVAVISPRRQAFAAPESATAQQYLFLDCSSFVWACYYHAFGYMLEADLTWHMIDELKPKVFYYELTHKETQEEIKEKIDEVRHLLQPGDVITYQDTMGNGHSMLYIDEKTYVNCSGHGTFNGYNYKENRNIFTECGGIYYEPSADLFQDSEDPVAGRNYLFKANKKRFAIHRPLDIVGEPTEEAMARIGAAAGLICSIEANYSGGRTVEYGSKILYKLTIRNTNETSVNVSVCYDSGKGCENSVQNIPEFSIEAGTEKKIELTAQADSCYAVLNTPIITVNGLHIAAPLIFSGNNLNRQDAEWLCQNVEKEYSENCILQTAVSNAYKKLGIFFSPDPKHILKQLFFLIDGKSGDVLIRRPQEPWKDMCLMTYFGGKGVISPESCTAFGVRSTYISKNDLQAGDIILVSDDANHKNACEYFWNGDRFLGADDHADELIDSLFGKFCFAVLRPSLTLIH